MSEVNVEKKPTDNMDEMNFDNMFRFLNMPSQTNIPKRHSREENLRYPYPGDNGWNIDILHPDVVVIIGCGGIGSWAATYFGRLSTIKHLVLFDPDNIEESNLNRTPFRLQDVGEMKVEVLAANLAENNPNLSVIPIPRLFNKRTVDELTKNDRLIRSLSSYGRLGHNCIVIDCRDDYYGDYDLIETFSKSVVAERYHGSIRVAYDGFSMTFDPSPEKHEIWGEGTGYTVQPSHVLPSSLAGLFTMLIAFESIGLKLAGLEGPYTFNVFEIPLFIISGIRLKEKYKNKELPEGTENVLVDENGRFILSYNGD